MSYKYSPIPEKADVVFLEVVTPLHWTYSSSDKNRDESDIMPIGSITWINRSKLRYDEDENGLSILIQEPEYSVHVENNRHVCNFSSKCFKLLHTSTQKIR
jgi:hypothetical protein